MTAVSGSGTRIMSDSWISWKPRMDEPSNPSPSSNTSSLNSSKGTVKCCMRPGRSQKRMSKNLASCCSPSFSASAGLGMNLPPCDDLGHSGRTRTRLFIPWQGAVSREFQRCYGRVTSSAPQPAPQASGLLVIGVLQTLDYPALDLASVKGDLHLDLALDDAASPVPVIREPDGAIRLEQLLGDLGIDREAPFHSFLVPGGL